jgi:ABC-type dipeptide/oligopeptide/nickel transport system permease subunit
MPFLLTLVQRLLNPRPDFSHLNRKQSEGIKARLDHHFLIRHVLFNVPLMVGGLIVLALFLTVLFGPLWAPENPYVTGQSTITFEDGELLAPPFPPSEEYPLGTDPRGKDLLSLILYGARNTLVACTLITLTRVLAGLGLGALAGWHSGKLFDRLVMGAISLTTALPILLSSMILIYALNIRRGLIVFIIAMSVVGWAEIAQYIRSEFIVLREKPFIEGARTIGLTGLGVAIRHVLPNVLPQLIVISLLEMSAVLMLLGELGFIGVYIGGGTLTTDFDDSAVSFSDIPEWGVLMADARQWAQAKPWMVFYPALAFFVSVLGFNALAEGLRQLIDQAAINTAFLLHKRTLLVVAAVAALTVYAVNNVGPAPVYANLANQFDGQAAYQHLQALTVTEGRGPTQPGSRAAAEYVASKFERYGLKAVGDSGSYFQAVHTRLVHPLKPPELILLDKNGRPQQSFRHQHDFGFVIQEHGGSGEIRAPLTFVGFKGKQVPWSAYKGLDLREQIVLLLADNAPADFATEALLRGAAGVLWVTGDDPEAIRSQVQLAGPAADYLRSPALPIFRIRPEVAETLLAPAQLTLADLRQQVLTWPQAREEPWLARPLTSRVQMSLALSEPEAVELVNVLGYLAGSDVALDSELVIVSAHYDGRDPEPDGPVYPAANDNASGLAVLLEIARLWQEQGVNPRRSVLFAAWGGGELNRSGAEAYFENYTGMISPLEPVAVFQLDNLGAGGDNLRLTTNAPRLDSLVEASADRLGVPLRRAESSYHPYQAFVKDQTEAVLFSWENSQVMPEQDRIERIRPEKLGQAGEVIMLALTNAVRQQEY